MAEAASPLVSICLPVFNMADTIERAIESALSQRYERLEVLLVDNCSNDGTWEIAHRFSDPRLRWHRNEANIGAYGNHNRCIELARGEWIKFLHGDDVLLPDCVHEMVAASLSVNVSVAMVACGAFHVTQGRKRNPTFTPAQITVLRAGKVGEFVLAGNIVGTPTMTLLRKSALIDIGGFDVQMEPGADGDCWIALMSTYPSVHMASHLVEIFDDPPGDAAARERLASRFCIQTMRQVDKWCGPAMEDRGFRELRSEWLSRESVRFWYQAAYLLLKGRTGLLIVLIEELRERKALWSSARMFLKAVTRRRSSADFRQQPWQVSLGHLVVSRNEV